MKKFILILTTLALVLSLAACGDKGEVSPSPDLSPSPSGSPSLEPSEEPSTEPSVEPTLPPPDYTYDSGNIIVENREGAEIYYPVFSSDVYPDGAAAANEYFESRAWRTAEGFIADAEEMGEDEHYSIEQGYSVWYEHGEYASVLVSIWKDYGGVHPGVEHSGHTVNFAEGTLVTLYDLFNADEESVRERILDEIIAQLPEREELYEDAEDAAREHFDPENFYLDDEGIVVFYQVYDLGPYVVGAQFFTIRYENLDGLADWVIHA